MVAIRFEGPAPPRRAERSPLAIGAEFNPSDAQTAAERLREAWQNADFPLARVRWNANPSASNDGWEVVFTSEPGPRGRLQDLRFRGNQAPTAEGLQAPLLLRPARHVWDRLTGRDRVRSEALAQDRQTLKRLYEEAGYLDAEIGTPQLEFLGEKRGFRLTWPIPAEGPRYHIRQIHWRGDPVPLPLRVWLGGSETLRGFAHRSASPLDENGGPAVGQSAW